MHPLGGSAKQVTRREVRARRTARGVAARRLVEEDLASHAQPLLALADRRRPAGRAGAPLLVAAYLSLPGEPGTGALLARLAELGHQVLLPWLREDRDLDWVPAGPGAGPADPLRPPGPRQGPAAVARADLVLVPALAVDGSGTRLGQGGGSYDRALARLRAPAPPVLAVVHDDEVLAAGALPAEAHDVAVDGVLTPSGATLLPRRAAGRLSPTAAAADARGPAPRPPRG